MVPKSNMNHQKAKAPVQYEGRGQDFVFCIFQYEGWEQQCIHSFNLHKLPLRRPQRTLSRCSWQVKSCQKSILLLGDVCWLIPFRWLIFVDRFNLNLSNLSPFSDSSPSSSAQSFTREQSRARSMNKIVFFTSSCRLHLKLSVIFSILPQGWDNSVRTWKEQA